MPASSQESTRCLVLFLTEHGDKMEVRERDIKAVTELYLSERDPGTGETAEGVGETLRHLRHFAEPC